MCIYPGSSLPVSKDPHMKKTKKEERDFSKFQMMKEIVAKTLGDHDDSIEYAVNLSQVALRMDRPEAERYYRAVMDQLDHHVEYHDTPEFSRRLVAMILTRKMKRSYDLSQEKITMSKGAAEGSRVPNLRALEEARALENETLALLGYSVNTQNVKVDANVKGEHRLMDTTPANPQGVVSALRSIYGEMIAGALDADEVAAPLALPEKTEK